MKIKHFDTPEEAKVLIQAIEKQDVSFLRGWLEQNDPNKPVFEGWAAIHIAVACGNLTACQALLEAGASPTPETTAPRTPLMLASELGHEDIVELLLKKGAPVDEPSFDGYTALSLSCGSSMGKIQSLMNAGADLNWVDGVGNTPLFRAAMWCPQLVDQLLEVGADPDYSYGGGSVMARVAEVASNNTIKSLLNSGADINTHDEDGKALIYILARRGSLDLCKMLVEKGLDPTCEKLRHDGKLPHEVAVGETADYLRWVAQSKDYRQKLMDIAGRVRQSRQLEDQDQETFFM